MSFDEEPDAPLHGECQAEITRLVSKIAELTEAKTFWATRCTEVEQENQILIEELKEARAESSRFGMGA